jgi:peptide/nickel transport system substrate-binding protein
MQNPLLSSLLSAGVAILLAATCGAPLSAQTLTVGMKGEPMALDPDFRAITTDMAVAAHIFDGLVALDETLKVQPALALSWKLVAPTTWEFNLRPGVKFSDGTPFTAADVAFSFDRVKKVPNSPSPMSIQVRDVQRVEVVNPMTVRVHTFGTVPTLPASIARLAIMSNKAAAGPAPEGKTTAQLNAGDGLVGTGPFKFVSWARGSEIVLEKNPLYWGPAVAWDKVVLRFIVNPAARLNALFSGGVDVIEDPAPDDLPRLLKDPKLNVESTPSVRIIYIGLDTFSPNLPGIQSNPLKDLRVRQALSLAIDRKALMERVMEGVAQPAADIIPAVMEGSRSSSKLLEYDLPRAKKLLAEAGYGSGFPLTLGAPNGRYINDAKVAQTLASMWGRLGLKIALDTPTTAIFFKNLVAYDYPSHLAGWGDTNSTGRLNAMLVPKTPGSGDGATNYGRYENPAVTDLVRQAASTVDDAARTALIQKATTLAVKEDLAVIPLHFENTAWVMRKGLTYPARPDQFFLSQQVRPAKSAAGAKP